MPYGPMYYESWGGGGVNRKFFTNTKIKPQTKNNNKTENKNGKFANLENPQLLL